MPIGDSKAQKYVIKELIRRSVGRHLYRQTQKPEEGQPGPSTAEGKSLLTNWWYSRKPFVRMVSNAVPHKEAAKLKSEYAAATTVFGEEPAPESTGIRFRHVLHGGVGFYNADDKTSEVVHNFSDLYGGEKETEASPGSGPFGSSEASFEPTDPFSKPPPGITDVNVSYKGDRGALKKAVITFKCYSLGDLERLE